MLFLLTGEIQTGKTRWLASLVNKLEACGVICEGVIAPGVWREHREDDGVRYEKLGIENVLLPGGERIRFATRRDLAVGVDPRSQSERAGLGWAIADGAIDAVNRHFEHLAEKDADADGIHLLIIDELGALELLRGEGLTAAVNALEHGRSHARPCALAIVRPSLLDTAESRFGTAWGGCMRIEPGARSRDIIFEALGLGGR